jgi:hypothetical protein
MNMNFGKGTVFVLGAGFARAFLQDAPLLVDHWYGNELRKKFANFPDALAMLDAELNDSHHPEQINIERLMTRLAGGMSYDFVAEPDQPIAANHPGFEAFFEELDVVAKQGPPDMGQVVALAGKYCLEILDPPPA